ncbi:unnamed protein product [Calicophoron daubneyi]|uniref:Uncharacterized protein n=1 Tax=Calicophoron daubneyi TaxID=300641 RepID=A0AAV2U1T6_CALDB
MKTNAGFTAQISGKAQWPRSNRYLGRRRQLHADSVIYECVANLAYKKSAWITPDNSYHRKRDSPSSDLVHDYQQDHARASVEPSKSTAEQYRPPMMANHRIGKNQNKVGSSSFAHLPFWPLDGSHHNTIINDVGDPLASLAVDGWTGEETVQQNSSLSTRSTEHMMNDNPSASGEASKQENQSVALSYKRTISLLLHSCTVLEYRWPFVELPSWYVDLREQTEVSGVVIYTARHGRNVQSREQVPSTEEEKVSLMSENLERLSIYVESEPRSRSPSASASSSSTLCGFVTRLNDAIFSPRLHIPCRQPLRGRYVYVEARGLRGRWSQEFSALLCEVMIY